MHSGTKEYRLTPEHYIQALQEDAGRWAHGLWCAEPQRIGLRAFMMTEREGRLYPEAL